MGYRNERFFQPLALPILQPHLLHDVHATVSTTMEDRLLYVRALRGRRLVRLLGGDAGGRGAGDAGMPR